MYLGKFIKNLDVKYKKTFFSGIATDSSKVKKDNIFFAIKGSKFDGNNFITSAIKNGSKIIISEGKNTKFQKGILFIQTNNVRKLLAEISFKIFNKIPKNLIAVTGTNGKSSIADFYFQILSLTNKKVASIGTLGVRSKKFNISLSNTTMDPIMLGLIFNKLKTQKIDNVIMEASSHGLKQNRLNGLLFNSAIFTNLSQDHLDYHKNLKDYLNAKLYLFKHLVKKKGNVITDNTIPEFNKIKKISLKKNLKLYPFNEKKNNFYIQSHFFNGDRQVIKIKYGNIIQNIDVNLIGKIQLKNLFMAIIAANKSSINLKKIFKILPKIKPVEGRFEKIGKLKNQSRVILDYAHTPDALKTCLANLKQQFPDKRIILLFGCGGNRDKDKRAKMGKIADNFSDKIYLTDDNPRFENPKKIRRDIRKGINKKRVIEISDRSKAIIEAVKDLNTGEILLVAGKGHEKIQDLGKKKIFFSDKKIILQSIKKKNLGLFSSTKLNLIKELSGKKEFPKISSLKKVTINSREVKKNDIFFAIRGKKKDGNKYVGQAFKKKASLAVVNEFQKNVSENKQIKVKNSLKFLLDYSKMFRQNISTKIIAITGSCGKTTLKELLGNSLKKISNVSVSPKSYNNKYGVPLSLSNINQNDDYGVLEVGMDKKGEIDFLSNIIKPDVSVITNINYAHAKNFKSLKQIALAKAEIINNTRTNGFVVLNADDKFFNLHRKIALKKNIQPISFGIQNKKSDIKLKKINKIGDKFKLNIKIKKKNKFFLLLNNFQNNIYNVLASLAVKSIFFNIQKLNKKIFLDFKTPEGRGDISRIKINKKNLNLIDESYNSNPLSLSSALKNYDKINTGKTKKYLLIGDMLELGSLSKKLHESILPIINQTNIDKVFVKGKKVSSIFNKISKQKKGRIFRSTSQIINFIRNDLKNNDYLMIKASNATGFNRIVNQLKGLN